MATDAEPRDRETLRATLTFVVDDGVPLVSESAGPGQRLRHRTGTFEPRSVHIEDARGQDTSLDGEGFVLSRHDTEVVDFHDEAELERVYRGEVEALLLRVTGASRVVVFDHTVRSGDPGEQEALHLREPVSIVHNDYTAWSGPQRLRDVLPDEADALLTRRVAIVQVWRPTHEPIDADPFALCDARTLMPRDFLVAERRHIDRVGEIYQLQHREGQRWLFYPGLRRHEVIVFKVYDSALDGRTRFGAHASFEDPRTAADAPPRRSIEARALVLFD